MAAGMGSRYGGSKQTDGVGPAGETLLEYGLYDAMRAGFGRVVFIIRRELEGAFESVTSRLPASVEVSFAIQDAADVPAWFTPPPRTKPWGTTHAVLEARNAVDTPFAVINADDFYGAASYDMAAEACTAAHRTGAYSVIGLPLADTLSEHGAVARGVCEAAGGWLVRLEEVKDVQRTHSGIRGQTPAGTRVLSGQEVASMNMWVFTPAVFGQLQQRFEAFLRASGDDPATEALLPTAINELLENGEARVRVRVTPGPWFGLTHAADRPRVSTALRDLATKGVYPDPLWAGPRLRAGRPEQ